ncbi:YigZ family protein [Chromobacterium sp. IIBBL 290-4]|uniref:IMPACT family protein n=1 Tax=Chromobacterium sp. IIBBL 290-4 TaxID=2953890 RepID=UPI0020B7914C|nr:YigZ family protein [Chromobacterium sp. IIBBL 290-4]UTH73410.1 IMPACT family protein [Chromobacterium sp. IIBBL 290-4]
MFQLAAPARAEIEIRKSRFIGLVYPVGSREEAQVLLAAIRREWPDARHYCAVLLCAGDSMLDDDGEPSGTAAKPMYNVLQHKQISNVLAVAVRYFGGIKLGAGGLVRAYTQAINAALDQAELIPVRKMRGMRLTVDFSAEARLRHLCQELEWRVVAQQYAEKVALGVEAVDEGLSDKMALLRDKLAGAVEIQQAE